MDPAAAASTAVLMSRRFSVNRVWCGQIYLSLSSIFGVAKEPRVLQRHGRTISVIPMHERSYRPDDADVTALETDTVHADYRIRVSASRKKK